MSWQQTGSPSLIFQRKITDPRPRSVNCTLYAARVYSFGHLLRLDKWMKGEIAFYPFFSFSFFLPSPVRFLLHACESLHPAKENRIPVCGRSLVPRAQALKMRKREDARFHIFEKKKTFHLSHCCLYTLFSRCRMSSTQKGTNLRTTTFSANS